MAELPDVPDDEFPEFVTVAWSLWSSIFLDDMPTFDEVRLEPIDDAFRRQDPDLTPAFVERYAQAWVRKQASSLLRIARSWLFSSMRASPDAQAVQALRETIERWWRVDQDFAALALDDLWRLDPDGSTRLMQQVASDPDASAELATRLHELLER